MTAGFLADVRVVDLLVERAVGGLSPESTDELNRLTRKYEDYDDDAIDRVAAAVSISNLAPEPVPETLRRRLEAEADWRGKNSGESMAETVTVERPGVVLSPDRSAMVAKPDQEI